MKISNIFSILFVALSLLAFSCNHTPAAKKEEKLNPADKVVSTLKSELEKINSALKFAKEIEIPADLLKSDKVKTGKGAEVKALYIDPMFSALDVTEGTDTKATIHDKLEALAKEAKKAKLYGAVNSLKKIDGYKTKDKYEPFLKNHKDVKDLIAGLDIK